MTELKIFDFKILQKEKNNVFITITGMTKSGKNVWFHEALYHMNKGPSGKYSDIFLFSSTVGVQDKKKYFPMIPDNRRFDNLTKLSKILEIRKNSKNNSNIMIILDDVTSMKEGTKMFRNSQSVINLATWGRHLNISAVTLLQKDTLVSPIIRNNSSYIVVFLPKSHRDLLSVKERYLSMCNRKTADHIFENTFNIPYQCLVVNQASPGICHLEDFVFKSIAPEKLRNYSLKLSTSKSIKNKNLKHNISNVEVNQNSEKYQPGESENRWKISTRSPRKKNRDYR